MDLRKPSGYFFILMGVVLTTMGIVAPDMRAPLTETNVNLYVGIVMLVFGGILLLLARRAAAASR
jgi:uncharacterized membrane protein YidH (DUF202 family)